MTGTLLESGQNWIQGSPETDHPDMGQWQILPGWLLRWDVAAHNTDWWHAWPYKSKSWIQLKYKYVLPVHISDTGAIELDLLNLIPPAKSPEKCSLKMIPGMPGSSLTKRPNPNSLFSQKSVRGWWPCMLEQDGKHVLGVCPVHIPLCCSGYIPLVSVCDCVLIFHREKWSWPWRSWRRRRWRRDQPGKAEMSPTWIPNWTHPSKKCGTVVFKNIILYVYELFVHLHQYLWTLLALMFVSMKQSPRHVVLLVYKPLQDHEVHRVAQIQMHFLCRNYPSAGDLVLRDPVLLSSCMLVMLL